MAINIQAPTETQKELTAIVKPPEVITGVTTEQLILQGLQAKQLAQARGDGAARQLAILEKITVEK